MKRRKKLKREIKAENKARAFEYIEKLKVDITNPNNIEFTERHILLGYLIVNNRVTDKPIVCCPYRGLYRVKKAAIRFEDPMYIRQIGFEVIKSVGKCV